MGDTRFLFEFPDHCLVGVLPFFDVPTDAVELAHLPIRSLLADQDHFLMRGEREAKDVVAYLGFPHAGQTFTAASSRSASACFFLASHSFSPVSLIFCTAVYRVSAFFATARAS